MHRKVQQLPQGHTANKQWSMVSYPDSLTQKYTFLATTPGAPMFLHSSHLESFENTPSKRTFNTLNRDLIGLGFWKF